MRVMAWAAAILYLGGWAAIAVAAGGSVSERLTLDRANAALTASGGMVGKIFAVGDNRYQVRRSRLTGQRGNVFTGEIEIVPLQKVQ